jgi:hypothetical protein
MPIFLEDGDGNRVQLWLSLTQKDTENCGHSSTDLVLARNSSTALVPVRSIPIWGTSTNRDYWRKAYFGKYVQIFQKNMPTPYLELKTISLALSTVRFTVVYPNVKTVQFSWTWCLPDYTAWSLRWLQSSRLPLWESEILALARIVSNVAHTGTDTVLSR